MFSKIIGASVLVLTAVFSANTASAQNILLNMTDLKRFEVLRKGLGIKGGFRAD